MCSLFKLCILKELWMFCRTKGQMNYYVNWHGAVGKGELAHFCSLLAPAITQHGRAEQPSWSCFFPFSTWQAAAGNGSILCSSLLSADTPHICLAQDISSLKYKKPSKQIVSLRVTICFLICFSEQCLARSKATV